MSAQPIDDAGSTTNPIYFLLAHSPAIVLANKQISHRLFVKSEHMSHLMKRKLQFMAVVTELSNYQMDIMIFAGSLGLGIKLYLR